MDIPVELRQVWAFTKVDFLNWSTYKTNMATQIVMIAIGVLSGGFNALYRNRIVEEYNTDYISFLMVGVLLANIIVPVSQGVEKKVNFITLENTLMTGVRMPVFVLGTISWKLLFSIVVFIPQLAIGIYWFGAKLSINIFSTILALLIASIIIFSLAVIATGVRMVTKSQDPITWSVNVLAQLLAGMTFPFQFIDNYIPNASTVSWFLPQTWIYHLTRLATLTNASITDPAIAIQFLVGIIYAVILLPIALYIFKWGLNRTKKDGTLGWF